ncbi:hypothetical protein JHK86_043371 [Glycine max]|nr:hypothetical protein JHK86_043371 [Glycine max]
MGRMSNHSFRAKIQRKTLTPKWHEEFKIPIITWEFDNVLGIAVRDKDHFYDDILGLDLLQGIAWNIWGGGKCLELMDPLLKKSFIDSEVVKPMNTELHDSEHIVFILADFGFEL